MLPGEGGGRGRRGRAVSITVGRPSHTCLGSHLPPPPPRALPRASRVQLPSPTFGHQVSSLYFSSPVATGLSLDKANCSLPHVHLNNACCLLLGTLKASSNSRSSLGPKAKDYVCPKRPKATTGPLNGCLATQSHALGWRL